MTDLGTDGADPRALDQFTGVAVVPVLVGKLVLCLGEGAQLSIKAFLILVWVGGGGRKKEGGEGG
jgi:hypothetical protein